MENIYLIHFVAKQILIYNKTHSGAITRTTECLAQISN